VKTHLKQNTWHDVVYLAHKLEELVVRQMLECELALRDIARIRLAKHRMTVTRNNLTALQRRPDVLLDCFVTGIFSNLGLHFCEPDEYFLVREAVQRTSETIQRRCIRKEWIRERGTDELSGVCRDVTTFVVTWNTSLNTARNVTQNRSPTHL